MSFPLNVFQMFSLYLSRGCSLSVFWAFDFCQYWKSHFKLESFLGISRRISPGVLLAVSSKGFRRISLRVCPGISNDAFSWWYSWIYPRIEPEVSPKLSFKVTSRISPKVFRNLSRIFSRDFSWIFYLSFSRSFSSSSWLNFLIEYFGMASRDILVFLSEFFCFLSKMFFRNSGILCLLN